MKKNIFGLIGLLFVNLASAQDVKIFPGADENTPSRAQYFSWINNTNEGATTEHTLINLDFFDWLKNEYGMQLDIYAARFARLRTELLSLEVSEIEKKLLRYPDWEYYDNAIHADFEFENFKDCFSAMSRIAFECEAQNHHPKWTNVYNVLKISLSTHDVDGVTKKDFNLADAIETIVIPEDE